MKLSISNIAWSAEHDEEMYAYLKEQGFKGLEIAPTRIIPENPYLQIDKAREWANNLKAKYGLIVPSMQSIWFGRQENIFVSEENRKFLKMYTMQAILFAEAIGCKNLVFGCPRNRDTADPKGCLPVAKEFFKEVGDFAYEHHTVVALEPNPSIYNTRFLNTTRQAAEVADWLSSQGVKVNVDLGTIIENNEDIEYLNSIPSLVNHVHISEPYLNKIVSSPLHHQLRKILDDIRYDGFISIEMKNSNDLDAVKTVMNYVKSIFG